MGGASGVGRVVKTVLFLMIATPTAMFALFGNRCALTLGKQITVLGIMSGIWAK